MLSIMSSPIFSDAVQNSVFQVMSEGSIKAVARPLFTLVDKNSTPEARKYSAIKEFIFQVLSLAFYFALVTPIVQKGGYKMIRKLSKNNPKFAECQKHLNLKSFLDARKAAKTDAEKAKFIYPKGAIETVNIAGSGIILTVLAPQFVNKLLLHPIMKSIDNYREQKNHKGAKSQDGDSFNKTIK